MLARVATPLEIAGVVAHGPRGPAGGLRRHALGRGPRERCDGARARAALAGRRRRGRRWRPSRSSGRSCSRTPRRCCPRPSRPPTCARPAWWPTCCSDAAPARSATGPALTSNLAAVEGADIVLVFVESYGAVTYDRPDFARALEPRRAQLLQQAGAQRPRGRVGVRRVAHLRRLVVARAPVLHHRHRGEGRGHQRPPHGPEAPDARHGAQEPRLPGGGGDARAAGVLARGRLLRVRSHLRHAAARLHRPELRLVADSRSVRAGAARAARARAARSRARVRVPPHHEHAHAVHADAAVSAVVATHAHRDAVRRSGISEGVGRTARLAEPGAELPAIDRLRAGDAGRVRGPAADARSSC